jgi:hypothetical protein
LLKRAPESLSTQERGQLPRTLFNQLNMHEQSLGAFHAVAEQRAKLTWGRARFKLPLNG